jgi:hypothetical protein
MQKIFKNRFDRVKNLVNGGSSVEDAVWAYELDGKDFHRLQQATKEFVKDCIFEYHGEALDDCSHIESFFMDNQPLIKTLPNITPNGLVMPI